MDDDDAASLLNHDAQQFSLIPPVVTNSPGGSLSNSWQRWQQLLTRTIISLYYTSTRRNVFEEIKLEHMQV
jgi:hypothetical protein